MSADTKRNVEVNLKIINDPASKDNLAQINKSLEKMAGTTKRNVAGIGDLASAYKNINKMQAESRRQWTNGTNRDDVISRERMGGKYAGGGVRGGMLAGGLVAGSLAAVDKAAAVARVGHDSFMTSDQKARALFRDIVPFGGRIQGYADSFSGRAAGMEKSGFLSQGQMAAQEGATRLQAMRLGMMPQLAGQRNLAQSLGSANPTLMGGIDRSTSAGEREFRERSRLLPIERDIAKNQREAQAATAARLAAETEMNKIVKRGNTLTDERASLMAKINKDSGSGVNRQIMLNRLNVVNESIEATRGQREQAWHTVYGAKVAEGQAIGATAMSRARYQEEKAGILEDRASMAAGQASTMGIMNPFDRARSVDAFKMLQQAKGDTSQLPPDMLQLAMSAGGASAQKLVEGYGARTNEYQQMKKFAPDVYAGDPEALRREASQARDEAERLKLQAEAEIAKTAAKAGENFGDVASRLILEFVSNALVRLENNMRLGKNAP